MRTYIIAEIGPNHNGNFEMAIELVERLAKIDIDAVKFQIADARKTFSLDAFKADYQKNNDNAEDVFEASKKRQLSQEEHKKLAQVCRNYDIDYLCTAFDLDNLIFLDKEINIPKFKIASGEIFSIDLLEYMSKQKKEIILSTGMATFEEIERSYRILSANSNNITILHCVSSYPAKVENINLLVMKSLQERFKTPVGYSDHTLGNDTAIAAVAMGATIVEKHVTLDKSLPGPDHKASATVEEFEQLVKSIRNVEVALGNGIKNFTQTELDIAKVARKSIVAKRKIFRGEVILEDDICYRRPGTGILPLDKHLVVGKIAIQDIEENRVIKKEQLS
ncbi:MAG: N-acetylneuraminate synthase family protein [Arcobacter sp.]